MSALIPFPTLLSRTTPERKTIVCTERCVGHSSHVLELYAVRYFGHKVSVTVDGKKYNVRIDDKYELTRIGLSFEAMIDFVEKETKRDERK